MAGSYVMLPLTGKGSMGQVAKWVNKQFVCVCVCAHACVNACVRVCVCVFTRYFIH